MFSPAGSRLPWKSFHDSTCRSVVCCRCPWFQSTATVSDSVCAPAMVTAPAGVAPTTASGAATTAASPVRISPPRTNREPSNARIMVPPLIEVSTSAHPYTAFAARGSRRVNILLSYIRRRGQPRTGPPVPRRAALAVPAAATAGAALPGCECGSVPVAGRLVAAGVTPAAALAFLLSAPAINPIVLTATAVAFPDRPVMVLARLLASLLASIVVGLLWLALGRDDLVRPARRWTPPAGPRLRTFLASAQHDFLQAGGFLVVGAGAAATLQTLVPRRVVDSFAHAGPLTVLALGVLAVLLALCSEADAFVAAGLKQFSLTARLAFLVVGPMVDVKLIALQAGTFGPRFAWRFAPLTFAVALVSAGLVGWWLL